MRFWFLASDHKERTLFFKLFYLNLNLNVLMLATSSLFVLTSKLIFCKVSFDCSCIALQLKLLQDLKVYVRGTVCADGQFLPKTLY